MVTRDVWQVVSSVSFRNCSSGGLESDKCRPSTELLLTYDGPFHFKNLINHLTRLSMSCKSLGDFSIKLCQLGIHLFSLCYISSSIFSFSLHFSRDRLIQNWYPSLNYTALFKNESDYCDFSSSAILSNEQDASKFVKIIDLTDSIHQSISPIPFSNTNSMISMTILSLMTMVYYYVGIITTGSAGIRCDFLTFLYCPLMERRRIQKELEDTFDNLLNSLQNVNLYCLLRMDSIDKTCRGSFSSHRKSLFRIFDDFCLRPSKRDKISLLVYKELNDSKRDYLRIYSNLMAQYSKLDSIDPAILTSHWHHKLSLLYKICLRFTLVTTNLTNLLLLIVFLTFEVNLRLDHRINHENCLNGSLRDNLLAGGSLNLTDYMYYNKLVSFTDDEAKLLSNYRSDQSFDNYLTMYRIEARYFFLSSINPALNIIISCLCTIWISFYGNLHIFSHWHRITWINQVNQQIVDCIESMDELTENRMSDNSKGPHESVHNVEIYKSIVVSYINYDLFRKQHKKFLILAKLATTQTATFSCMTMLSAYIIGTTVKVDSRLVLLTTVTYIVLHANFYLVLSAILTHKVEKFRNNIIRFLASTKRSDFQFCHIVTLWQKQLISPDETRELFSPCFLGIYISYINLMKVNGYLAALWLVIMRI